MSNILVIEVSGGVVGDVFSDDGNIQVVLIDWDNINEGDEAGAIPVRPLSDMSPESDRQLRIADRVLPPSGYMATSKVPPITVTRKSYLGDSVYAAIDEAGALVLTTENGDEPSNTIILEDSVRAALLRYIRDDQQRGTMS